MPASFDNAAPHAASWPRLTGPERVGSPGGGRRTRVERLIVPLAALACLVGPVTVCRAQVTVKTLLGRPPSDAALERDLNAAIGRFRDRDVAGCREILDRIRSEHAAVPPPGVMMALLWHGVNQAGPARVELDAATLAFPDDPEPYLLLGDIAFRERRVTEAALLFDRAADLTAAFSGDPRRTRDLEIRNAAGNAAVAETRGQWETARAWLTTWLHLDPDNAGAHQRMGIAMFRLGDTDRALACFREARTLDEKAVHPEIALARLYADAKDDATARRLVESALAAAPDDPAVHVAAAQWHLGRNDLEAAARAADAALALDPDKLDARIVRGTVARMQREYAAAATFFEAALAGAPGSFLASNALALALIESDDEAARRRALELAETNAAMHRDGSPHQIGALTTLAWIAYRLGRREDAERILEPISRHNALTADGAFYVATILADRGERDRARAILEEVLATDPMFVTRPDALDLLERLGATAARNVGTSR